MKSRIQLVLAAALLAAPIAALHAQQSAAALPPTGLPSGSAGPQAVQAMVDANLISRGDAMQLVVKSVEACESRGQRAAAFVTDADGHQRASLSADGMNPIGLRSAARKTATVMFFKQSTHTLRDRLAADPAFAAEFGKDERYYFSPGGMPLYRGSKFVGVLAVGGGRTIDEECALEAIKAVTWVKTSPN